MVAANLEDVSVGLDPVEIDFAARWMQFYRGLKAGTADVEQAVKDFQFLYGLEIDGVLGPKTLHAMTLPRCGLPDVEFARDGAVKWGLKRLKWAWVGEPIHPDQDGILQDACNSWTEVSDIAFDRVKDASVANVVMTSSDSQRDGLGRPGGVLAFAELCPAMNFTGQLNLVFDKRENYLRRGQAGSGVTLHGTGCHELGHILGFEHSKIPTALMAPYAQRGLDTPQANDDIPRVVSVYGQPTTAPPPVPPPGPPGSGPKKLTIYIDSSGNQAVEGYRLTKLAG